MWPGSGAISATPPAFTSAGRSPSACLSGRQRATSTASKGRTVPGSELSCACTLQSAVKACKKLCQQMGALE